MNNEKGPDRQARVESLGFFDEGCQYGFKQLKI